MLTSIALCLISLFLTMLLVRNRLPSFGLPVGYLYLLLLIHVPGAVAHYANPDSSLAFAAETANGIRLTAFGCIAFVLGLWIARSRKQATGMTWHHPGSTFQIYCLVGGWIATYALRPLIINVPSIGAAVEYGSRLWILPILISVSLCLIHRRFSGMAFWIVLGLIFPVTGLLFGGFVSYGSTTVVLMLSGLFVTSRSMLKSWVVISVVSIVGMGLFVSYFQLRNDIRDSVWGGAPLAERIDQVERIATEFALPDLKNQEHLDAFNERLNQNIFVGLAADRLELEIVPFYQGETIWQGLISLIPRAIWAGKPVYGGSGDIIEVMCGLPVNEETSFGVGNVMEFYINWGIPSLLLGFLLFGWIIGILDREAASAYVNRNYGQVIVYFLPALAIIRPGESIVEMTGGAAAGLVAGKTFQFLWPIIANPNRLFAPNKKPRADKGSTGAAGLDGLRR